MNLIQSFFKSGKLPSKLNQSHRPHSAVTPALTLNIVATRSRRPLTASPLAVVAQLRPPAVVVLSQPLVVALS